MLDIVAEPRRIANRIVEEAMIAANICAARVLRDKLGFSIYNVHMGFDPANADALAALLKTLRSACRCRRSAHAGRFSANCVVNWFRNQLVSSTAAFVASSHLLKLALNPVLTLASVWKHTPPGLRRIRKVWRHDQPPSAESGYQKAKLRRAHRMKSLSKMADRHRLNRMAERDVGDWLYNAPLPERQSRDQDTRFAAEIVDISRGGMRVRLVDNGAIAFIPAPFLHAVRR